MMIMMRDVVCPVYCILCRGKTGVGVRIVLYVPSSLCREQTGRARE